MKNRAVQLLLIAFMFVSLLSMAGLSVFAQSSVVYDFTVSDEGFVPHTFPTVRAVYVAGVGWHKHPDRNDRVTIQHDTANLMGVEEVRVYVNCADVNSATVYNVGSLTCSGGVITATFPGGVDIAQMFVDLQMDGSDDPYITRIEVDLIPLPTNTPTITLTPTITPTPIPSEGVFSHRICVLLNSRAEFRNGWTFTDGADFAVTGPNRFLELPPGGRATLTLALSPTKQYGLSVLLRGGQTGDNGTITLGLGTSAAYSIPIESHTDLRGFTTAPITYQPDENGGYTVEFSRPTTTTGTAIVEYFCLQAKTTDDGSGAGGTGAENDRCSTCVAPDWFGDLGGILNWLICQLKNLLTCYLAQWLVYIAEGINKVTGFALDIFIWMVDGFNATVAWINAAPGQILRFFGGTASNTMTSASNAFHTSGAANALNVTSSGMRDLPTTLYNIFNGLVGQVGSAIVESGSLIEIILKLIVVAFSAIIFALFGLVPIIITSLLAGFFSPSNITSLSMTCTNPSSYLYYPCLIFYALDNTVLAGPAGYLFPLVMGMWALQTFTWALNRVKEEISG